jgi:carotenoid cleavage dioxygenase-like enzyme
MSELWKQATGRGYGAPMRFEGSVTDCEVVGKIPAELNGAFYRTGAEWYYPPTFKDDAILNADGYVSSFRIKNGKVDYHGQFVRTYRFVQEQKAARQLYGYYRNPYTDDPSVRDPMHPNLRTVSNTAPLAHGGKLFTLKEDGLPYEADPDTLATKGTWDFHGKYKSETFSAHPKIDPLTGEMIAYGYEASGLGSDDIFLYTIDRSGHVRHEQRFKQPYVSLIHDMAITHRHVVLPFGGYVTNVDWLKAGKIHWWWDATKPSYIGVARRDGDGKSVRWFKGPLRCMMHVFNAYDDGDKVVLYAPFYDGNFFPFFPNTDGTPFNPALARSLIRKITLDLSSKSDTWQEEILWPMPIVDLGKVDPRVVSLQPRYLYTSFSDEARPYERAACGPGAPARMTNSYGRFDLETGKVDRYFAGPTHNLQELSFVPTGDAEGQGYLVGVAANYAEMRSELVIVDAQRLGDGDVARVILPFRISQQVHGVWAGAGGGADQLPLK